MTEIQSVIDCNDLTISYLIEGDMVPVVDHVSFSIRPGEIVSVVGESGSGKSQLALALTNLLSKSAHITGTLDRHQTVSSMIFQDPLNALNPVLTVGDQIAEALPDRHRLSKSELRQNVNDLLTAVGISDGETRQFQYPHEFSGGMRQRVLIAMALARDPDLLIADEPTTALDVTIQAQILELLKTINQSNKLAILFITHDLSLVRNFSHRVIVMYAGELVEVGKTDELLDRPRHPYTSALLHVSRMEQNKKGELASIEGSIPDPAHYPQGCRFAPRCPVKEPSCEFENPPLHKKDNHQWLCIHENPGSDVGKEKKSNRD